MIFRIWFPREHPQLGVQTETLLPCCPLASSADAGNRGCHAFLTPPPKRCAAGPVCQPSKRIATVALADCRMVVIVSLPCAGGGESATYFMGGFLLAILLLSSIFKKVNLCTFAHFFSFTFSKTRRASFCVLWAKLGVKQCQKNVVKKSHPLMFCLFWRWSKTRNLFPPAVDLVLPSIFVVFYLPFLFCRL